MKKSITKLNNLLQTILTRKISYFFLFIVYCIVSDPIKLTIFIIMGAVFYNMALKKYIKLQQNTLDEVLKHFKEECQLNNITINKILQVGRDADG